MWYLWWVRRALAVLTLFLVIGSATGAFAAVSQDASCEDCGDGDNGCCPPICPQCVCVARGVAADLPKDAPVPPGPDGVEVARIVADVGAPDSADPHEIFHVPIALG